MGSRKQNELALGDFQLASGCASMSQKIILHPVDTLKTRLQHLRLTSETEIKDPAMHMLRFVQKEGMVGLYRGVTSSLIGSIPVSMVYMPSYEISKRSLPDDMPDSLRHLIAGTVAGVLGSLVRTPVDLVKKRTQVGLHGSAWEAMRVTVGNGGVLALWGNAQASLMYDVPYNMVQFSILEQVKVLGRKMKGGKDLESWENVLVGASTGIMTSILTEPLDVIKTRLMTKMGYSSWLDALKRTAGEEGILALWKGTLPRMVWVAAGSAIWYSVYENIRLHLQRTKYSVDVVQRPSSFARKFVKVAVRPFAMSPLRSNFHKRQICAFIYEY